MNGLGIVRGMLITLWHFLLTYAEDLKRFPRRYRKDAASVHQTPRYTRRFDRAVSGGALAGMGALPAVSRS